MLLVQAPASFFAKPEIEIWGPTGYENVPNDFIRHPNAIYWPIDHCIEANQLFPVYHKPEVLISNVGRPPKWLYCCPQVTTVHLTCIHSKIQLPTRTLDQTGNRNMAEIAKMNSQLPTSYSTSYTLWGLSPR